MRICSSCPPAIYQDICTAEAGASRILKHQNETFAGNGHPESRLSRTFRVHPVVRKLRCSKRVIVHFHHLQLHIGPHEITGINLGSPLPIAPVQKPYPHKIIADCGSFLTKLFLRSCLSKVRFRKQMGQTIRHHLMARIGWMVDVIEILPLGNHVPLRLGQPELPGNRVLDAHHRQPIATPHRSQPVLKVPVVGEHTEQQNDRRLLRLIHNVQAEALEAIALRFIPGIIHGKFHHHNVRPSRPMPQNIPFIPDQPQLRWRSANPRFDKMDVVLAGNAKQPLKPQV
ncbi:hypothetical protein D3C75_811970 [compost metagenome]